MIGNKRGQLALWVILAVVLLALIIIFFSLDRSVTVTKGEEFNTEGYIESCVKNSVEEGVDLMLPQGGFVSPDNFKFYKGYNVEYLCENKGYYEPCINQHPVYFEDLKNEIKNYMEPEIKGCFINLKKEIEDRGGSVSFDNFDKENIEIGLSPGEISVDLHVRTEVSYSEENRGFENFEVKIVHPLYDLAKTTMEIVNSEAKYCYFEYVGYMVLYPEFLIEKNSLDDGTKLYSVIDRNTNQKISFAIRGCAIPAGY